MENDGIPSGEPAPLDPIHGSSAIYDSHGYMIGVLDNNRDVGSNNASTSNDVNMASETDIVPSNDTRRRDDVNGHVVSIDFDGKQVHLADITEADNSVRYNTTAFYGQFVNKLGCQHLKPNFSDEMIILDDGITSKRLWYSTVVLPGFESRGPVHPSPDDVCQYRVDRSAIEELLGTGALRPVYFQQKRDARNAALSQAYELFMDYVRSNYVIANEPQN